jgi:hypothetical protein
MDKAWTIRIKGIVVHCDDRGRRVAVPHGSYTLTESHSGDYLVSGGEHPAFTLTAKEATGYIRGGDIDIESGGAWP